MSDIGELIAQTMRAKLVEALAAERVDVVDESHLHHGHAGARPNGGTHFRLTVVAQAFAGRSRVERQRLVHDILAAELRSRVHALSLTTLAPDEATPSGVKRSAEI